MPPKDNPAVYFELGWALVGANNFIDGIRQLDRFLHDGPIEPSLKARAEQLRSFAEREINNAERLGEVADLGKPDPGEKCISQMWRSDSAGNRPPHG